MFFDDATKRKPDGKVRLRLADQGGAPLEDAATRHRNARIRRETAGPSLLDRTPVQDQPPRQSDEGAARSGKWASVTEQLAEIDRRNAEILKRERENTRTHPTSSEIVSDSRAATASTDADMDEYWQDRPSHHDDGAPLIDPRHVFRAVRSWKSLILATTMLGGLAGTYVALNTPKLYFSSATVVIDPRNYKVIENDLNPDVFLSEAALAIVDSQVSLMRSPRVLEKVSQKLSLQNDPEFNGSGARGIGRFFGFLSGGDNQDYTSAALEYLAEHMSAERAPKTFVVSIGAYSEDAEKAALIANTIVDIYLEEQSSSRSDTAKRTSGELTARLENLRTDVEKAETAVEAFKAENNLIGAQGRLIEDEEILRVNDQLTAARSNTIALNARAQTAKSVTVDAVASGSLPEEIASTAITGLRSQYVGAKQRIDGLAAKLGPRHPDLQQASNEAESLRNAIIAEINRIRQSIQTDLKRAVETEQSLAARLAQLKARSSGSGEAQVKLRELEREAVSARTVYEQFLLRARETGEQGNINANNVQKISEARASDTPEGASRKLIVLGGLIAGFIAGLGLAMAKGMFDSLKLRFGGGYADPNPSGPEAPSGAPGGGAGRPKKRLLSKMADRLPPRLQPQPAQPAFVQAQAGMEAPAPAHASVQPPAPAPHYQQPIPQPPLVQQPHAPSPVWPQMQQPVQPVYQAAPAMQPVYQPAPMPAMQPVYHQMPVPAMMPPLGYPMPAMIPPLGYPMQPVMQPVFMHPAQMVPQMQQPVQPSHADQRDIRSIRETLDGLHAELAELSRRRRSA